MKINLVPIHYNVVKYVPFLSINSLPKLSYSGPLGNNLLVPGPKNFLDPT